VHRGSHTPPLAAEKIGSPFSRDHSRQVHVSTAMSERGLGCGAPVGLEEIKTIPENVKVGLVPASKEWSAINNFCRGVRAQCAYLEAQKLESQLITCDKHNITRFGSFLGRDQRAGLAFLFEHSFLWFLYPRDQRIVV
jgi:hypothetical protein